MTRYGVRDEWERIKDLLPGRIGQVGVTAQDNRRSVEAVLYRYRAGIPGAICRNVLAIGRIPIGGSVAGPRAPCGNRSLSIWPPTPTTNMRCSTAPSFAPISTAPGLSKKDDTQAVGHSRGGLSTKIHALVDALGNPVRFVLTPGQAHDLVGADALLPQMTANRLIADKAFDADQRVRRPLAVAGKLAVIPPRDHRRTVPDFDPELYRARHLIENFSCKLKQFRAIATRYDKTAKKFPRRHPPRRRDHLAQLTTRPSGAKHTGRRGSDRAPLRRTYKALQY
jgi:transposase